MKFSDAMMLGMSAARLAAGSLARDGAVCALGAGYCALGWLDEQGNWLKSGKTEGYEREIVKWLRSAAESVPCGCSNDESGYLDSCLLSDGSNRAIIAHVFNQHVMGDKTWTVEKLVDYVRSIEPAEESNLPDLPLSEQLRLEEEAAAEEGAAIEASGYPDPAENVRFA